MLFQNTTEGDADEVDEVPNITSKPNITGRKKVLEHILSCQTLSKATNMGKRGEIAEEFCTGKFNDEVLENTKTNFLIWSAARSNFLKPMDTPHVVPSFTSTNSLFADPVDAVTRFSFTPIIPHPATEYDTIFTCMLNFQDVLSQRNQEYGPLWCDEGVYRIAKELQLLNPSKFANIFLGLGGFHFEKVLIGCCGAYLSETGIQSVLVQNEVFGPGNVQSVMSGGNYIRGKRGMMLIAEALLQLQIEAFVSSSNFDQSLVEDLQLFRKMVEKEENYRDWKYFEEHLQSFICFFNEYIESKSSENLQFKYWNVFIQDIVSVLIDLTRSHREGNWKLHLSSIRRAIPLLFTFNRTNYRRWVPLYFEDCLKLENKFPKIYDSFLAGGFVVSQTRRRGSKLPMDQALEKQYNKPAKGQSGIIGFSRRKEAVCKWNIVKHEKSQYTSSLEKVCDIINEDEYSIHHEFSMSRTETDVSAVNQMMDYIKNRGNPFEDSNPLPRNFKTGELMREPLAKSLIRAVETGEREYSVFKDKRLETKSIKLFDTIQNVKLEEKQCSAKKPPDVNKETLSFLRTIDIARLREYDLQVLLQYEITSCSFYLTKDGNLRKSPKSDLATELKRSLATIPNDVPSSAADSVIIFDFMAFSRKVPVKKIKLQTFEDLFKHLFATFKRLSAGCQRIDIVFDIYLDSSIKQHERKRRSEKHQSTETIITSIEQALPVEFESFWGSSSNKMQFQQSFIDWVVANNDTGKPLFLGGANKEDMTSCLKVYNDNPTPQHFLKCTHEEADDRLMLHITHAVNIENFTKVIVASSDTDILVNLVHHYLRWQYSNLQELWLLSGTRNNQQAISVHDLTLQFDGPVLDVLPAVHALTG